jgi:hypothetical protein
MIAGLTKSHEEQSSRQAAHLASVMEQRISEANVRRPALFSSCCLYFILNLMD